jgi:L-threonylcarbamoyladenylate synthase
MTKILKIDPNHPEEKIIAETVSILRRGGIIVYPTETFYGLGVDGENEQAIEKIFHVKGRAFRNPIALIIGDETQLNDLITEFPAVGHLLADKLWPGPLTLVMKASAKVSPRLTAGSGKIGIRISSHPLAKTLAMTFSRAITATSANLSGAPECNTVQQVLEQLGDSIDAIIDGGMTPGGEGSTFLDITTEPPTLLRKGVVPESIIRSCMRR